MAKGGRRYARDNRGRFASVGATARGGRLKTAGGNKRATVTVKAKGGGNGTIAKPKGLKPGTLKPKTRQVKPVPAVPSSLAGASRASARLARNEANINRTRYESIAAARHAVTVKSPKALAASEKAKKSQMTALRARDYLTGRTDSGSFQRGARYGAGNRTNVAAAYSFKRTFGAFRNPQSRIVAPLKGTKMGRPIPGSGGQSRGVTRLPRQSGSVRRRSR